MTETAPEADRVPGAPHPREATGLIGHDTAVADFIAAKRGQAVQTQFKDRTDLNFAEPGGVATPRIRFDRFDQREIGRDSRSFGTALRSALREDPDIILVGEMRDLETISLALEAAETGHLVFATLHTISAPKTIDRIIEVFPPEEQAQIRTSLSESIQAIIAQTLFKRADKKGRVPALEIMFGIPSVRNMIRESKTFQLPSVLQTNRNVGMQTMDDDIERLLMQRIITPEAALVHAQDKGRLREAIGKLK